MDGFNVVSLKPGAATELLLTSAGGQQRRTFADKEGWFTLHDVAPGSYVISTFNPMFVYPEVRRCQGEPTGKLQMARGGGVHTRLPGRAHNNSRGDTTVELNWGCASSWSGATSAVTDGNKGAS